jgi:hypothetical protein
MGQFRGQLGKNSGDNSGNTTNAQTLNFGERYFPTTALPVLVCVIRLPTAEKSNQETGHYMQKLKIDLENCYGIRALNVELDFTKKKANIVYAPNGMMKTSFAQTFKDLSEGKETKDRIYTSRQTKRGIADESGVEIPGEQIFVIEPYVQNYESSRISTLLVNKELKEEYDKILVEIEEKKTALLKELKKSSGIKNDIEKAISQVFAKRPDDFLNAIARVDKEVSEETKTELSAIIYNQIFNDKVEEFLNTKDFKNKLLEYTQIYDTLLRSSNFFKKGIFNHYQASEIAKNIKAMAFLRPTTPYI